MASKKKGEQDTTKDFKAIDDILAETNKRKKRSTSASDTVPMLMGANIKEFDVDSQFDITNQRMLAVRDDLTQFINANFGRLATEMVQKTTAVLRDQSHAIGSVANDQKLLFAKIGQLQMQIEMFERRSERRWWKTAYRKIRHFLGSEGVSVGTGPK